VEIAIRSPRRRALLVLRRRGQAESDWSIPVPQGPTVGTHKAGVAPDNELKATVLFMDDALRGRVVFRAERQDRVRLDEHDQPVTLVGNLHGPLGMAFDEKNGRLISLQTEPGFTGPRVVWPTGKEAIIADNYEGKPFGRPNDIVADRNGGLYFTDISPDRTVIPSAVYYVPPGGAPVRVAEGITTPNGLQLSHDEKTLYVNDTGGINIYAFDVQPDGRLANRRVFASYVGRDQTLPPGAPPKSNADGLVTDNDGRLYALTESGIEVLSPTGQPLGVIPLWCITRRCQNLGFGGPSACFAWPAAARCCGFRCSHVDFRGAQSSVPGAVKSTAGARRLAHVIARLKDQCASDPGGDTVEARHRDCARAALALGDRDGHRNDRRHRGTRAMQHAACQHDDLVGFPRALPREGRRRRPTPQWRRRRPSARCAGALGASAIHAGPLLSNSPPSDPPAAETRVRCQQFGMRHRSRGCYAAGGMRSRLRWRRNVIPPRTVAP
jgi:gluconolactonase